MDFRNLMVIVLVVVMAGFLVLHPLLVIGVLIALALAVLFLFWLITWCLGAPPRNDREV